MKFIIFLLLFLPLMVGAAPSPFIYGPNGTAKNLAPNGIYPLPYNGTYFFDDFLSGNTNNGYSIGAHFRQTGNAGGGIAGGILGSDVAAIVGRIGLAAPATGATNNATGQGIIDQTTAQTYAGQGAMTITWAAQMPSALASGTGSGVDYVIEMGCGSGYVSGGTAANNSMLIQYKASASTHFQTQTCNAATCTTTTDAQASTLVTINKWNNFKIVVNAAGTSVSYYLQTSGSAAWVLIGSAVTTNLPDISDSCNLVFQIYKASTSTTSRQFVMDWVSFQEIFATAR